MNFKLFIENFFAIQTAEVDLSNRGLVAVQGVNEDDTSTESNGAGKSSVFDALSWCLYGATARGEDGDRVVNRAAGKDCCVRSILTDAGLVHEVVRYRKHSKEKNNLKLYQILPDGSRKDLTQGTTALTEAEIVKIVGASHEVFCGSVYAGQERMPDLPGMTDKGLKVLVEEAAGVTLLEAAYKEAQARHGKAKERLTESQNALNSSRARASDSATQIADLRGQAASWDASAAALTTELSGKLAALQAEVVAKERAMDAFDVPYLTSKCTELDSRIASLAAERKEENRLNAEVTRLSLDLATAKANLNALIVRLREKKAEADQLDHKIGCPCSTCARPFTAEDIAPAKKLARDDLVKLAAGVRDGQSKVNDAQSALERAQDALSVFRASMSDSAKLTEARALLQHKLMEANTASAETARSRQLRDQADKTLKDQRAAKNPFTESIAKAERFEADLEKRIEELEEIVRSCANDVELTATVVKVFSPAGVRAHILDEVTPFLNDQTAKYLSTLSDGNIQATWSTLVPNAKGELKEKFTIEVTNACGGETFKSISGGEKRKVRIAAALALQDLVARRAVKPIELFIGDEIDDALDAAGRERLMAILEEKARERGSVFVISHSSLKDWISNVLTVTKKGKVSTVAEVRL